jgi:hypothetical protein
MNRFPETDCVLQRSILLMAKRALEAILDRPMFLGHDDWSFAMRPDEANDRAHSAAGNVFDCAHYNVLENLFCWRAFVQ